MANQADEKMIRCVHGNPSPGPCNDCEVAHAELLAQREADREGHDPDLDENNVCRVCGEYEPE